MRRAFTIKLGSRARDHIARHGLKPADIACVPAAAGGPKGLALLPLDRWLFGHWLQSARDLTLIGASIGAWRMAAAADADPVAALAALERAYIEDQNYGVKPGSRDVAARMHLFYPYQQLDRLTLYPHFTSSVTPGRLDKFLWWRKQGIRGSGAASLSSMILVAAAAEFVARLPARLPDRKDFYHDGTDHAARIAAWKRAVAECARYADEVAGWLENPDLSIAKTL